MLFTQLYFSISYSVSFQSFSHLRELLSLCRPFLFSISLADSSVAAAYHLSAVMLQQKQCTCALWSRLALNSATAAVAAAAGCAVAAKLYSCGNNNNRPEDCRRLGPPLVVFWGLTFRFSLALCWLSRSCARTAKINRHRLPPAL